MLDIEFMDFLILLVRWSSTSYLGLLNFENRWSSNYMLMQIPKNKGPCIPSDTFCHLFLRLKQVSTWTTTIQTLKSSLQVLCTGSGSSIVVDYLWHWKNIYICKSYVFQCSVMRLTHHFPLQESWNCLSSGLVFSGIMSQMTSTCWKKKKSFLNIRLCCSMLSLRTCKCKKAHFRLNLFVDLSYFGPGRSPYTEDSGVSYSRPPVLLWENKAAFFF